MSLKSLIIQTFTGVTIEPPKGVQETIDDAHAYSKKIAASHEKQLIEREVFLYNGMQELIPHCSDPKTKDDAVGFLKTIDAQRSQEKEEDDLVLRKLDLALETNREDW